MSKKPSFFCERCGTKVAQNEKACPHCGRYFASVKCPSCNFTGESKDFTQGCPRCGYALPKETYSKQNTKGKNTINDSLPFWVYLVALLLLVLVLFLL
ncbi:MAG TPA: zinc ribbon domain-containing protein [Treponemataceae bacterium]|jgi:rubrerythrin|nr:zinc ribbon domain-containing protein [Treponemataceae bacterium]